MRRPILPLLALALAAAGCSVTDYRPDASIANVVDTVTLGALHGSALATPSAFSVANNTTVRTDQSSNFDFAYDIVGGKRLLIPIQLLGLVTKVATNPGFQSTALPFDSIAAAPINGYDTDSSQVADSGRVLLARSSIVCSLTGTASYAKLQVLSYNDSLKTLTFRILANVNCGYHGLQPGLPTN